MIQKHSGFSMMEVLIAMLVIAVGLLGYLSLQLTSINSNQEGMARSQANLVAQDLTASIRANRAYVNQGDGTADVGNLYVTSDYTSCDAEPASCSGGAANCTDEQQASYDVYRVCQSVTGFNTADTTADLLINGEVHVDCDDRDTGDVDDCSPGSTLSVFAYWEAGALREDTGQKDLIRNQRCGELADDPGENFDCVILDIMP